MKINKIFISFLVLAVLGSCTKIEDKFDSYLNNPNTPTPESANSDLYLNVVQLSFADLFNGFSNLGMQITRQIVMYGPTYQNAYSPVSFDGLWDNAYTQFFKHANALIPIAEGQKKYVVVGMTKIMKAYVMMTMVDYFGNIPYGEANLGAENTNPKLETGKDVYAAAITLLDEAIADLAKPAGSYPGNFDLFYGVSSAGGKAKWVTLANTLKLRAYMTTRLADASAKSKIDALLTSDLIDDSTATEDFEFKYSTKQTNPNSRHPWYNGNYNASGGAGDYMGTYFMWALIREKQAFSNNIANDKSDPRTRYYLYRQRINYAEVNQATSSCSVEAPPAHYPPGMPFCLITSGYWGRDHGDNSGIPPDGEVKTTVGVYPAGGSFDFNQGKTVTLNQGGQGAGIQPIWQSAFTDFLKAEAALVLGTAGDPRALLVSAITKSFDKVTGFPGTVGVTIPDGYAPTTTRKTDYINFVLAKYDAGTADDKLDIIIKEYYLALWGNGIDAYNNYRRTGKPGNMQLTKTPNPGAFISSMYYPAVYVNRNLNAAQKSVDVHVFWDTNPAGFNK